MERQMNFILIKNNNNNNNKEITEANKGDFREVILVIVTPNKEEMDNTPLTLILHILQEVKKMKKVLFNDLVKVLTLVIMDKVVLETVVDSIMRISLKNSLLLIRVEINNQNKILNNNKDPGKLIIMTMINSLKRGTKEEQEENLRETINKTNEI